MGRVIVTHTYGKELFPKTITVTVIQLIELKGNKNYFELAGGSSYRESTALPYNSRSRVIT